MTAHHVIYLIRVWLPDRPGALAAVAARLGALRGDVLGLEIIERENGLAVDEITVSLPPDVAVESITREVGQVEDVEIEDLRRLEAPLGDAEVDAIEAAASLVEADTPEQVVEGLSQIVARIVRASWVCVLDAEMAALAAVGDCPNRPWITSFVSGSPPCTAPECLPDMDTVWVPMPKSRNIIVVGSETSIRSRERRRVIAVSQVADNWLYRIQAGSECSAAIGAM